MSTNPLRSRIFNILANKGWVRANEFLGDYFRPRSGPFTAGYLVVRESAVESFGVVPQQTWSFSEFVNKNVEHLFPHIK